MDIIILIILYFAWKWYVSESLSTSSATTGRAQEEDPENDPISPAYVGNDYAPHRHGNDGVEHP